MNVNKLDNTILYKDEIDILNQYNIFVKKYQTLLKEVIKELSKFKTFIIEDPYQYCVINNIKYQLEKRKSICCWLFDKETFKERDLRSEITIKQLVHEIAKQNKIRIINDEDEINYLLKRFNLI